LRKIISTSTLLQTRKKIAKREIIFHLEDLDPEVIEILKTIKIAKLNITANLKKLFSLAITITISQISVMDFKNIFNLYFTEEFLQKALGTEFVVDSLFNS
jgi:hypothetical protein